MSKKLILFLMLAIFGSTNLLKADEVTIGDPSGATTSSYYPVYSQYEYSFTQQIYTAEEIGMAGTINSLTMWLMNPTTYSRNVQIYMKNVEKDAFLSMDDWVPMSAEDLVATGTINNGVSIPEAVTFNLTAPFEYDDAMNLVICFADVTGAWNGYAASVVFEGEATRTLFAYRDDSPYDIANPGTANNGDTYRSVVMLDITVPFDVTSTVFGPRPNNAWMEPATVKVLGTGYEVTAMDIDNDYFTFDGPGVPFTTPATFAVTTGNAATGDVTGYMTLVYEGSRAGQMVKLEATAYDPAEADVVETAPMLPVNFTNLDRTPDCSMLYHNYNLPGEASEGKDVVYKLKFTHDVILKANISPSGTFKAALYPEDFGGEEGPKETNAYEYTGTIGGNDLIGESGLYVTAGIYYLVAQAANPFTLNLNTTEATPLQAYVNYPSHGAVNVSINTYASWTLGDYTEEMQVLLGTEETLTDDDAIIPWTSQLTIPAVELSLVEGETYYLQVNERNAAGETKGETVSFTTIINAPYNLLANGETEAEIFEGDVLNLTWDYNTTNDDLFRGFNLYKTVDGINSEKVNEVLITENEYEVEVLDYNMSNGYWFYVRTVFSGNVESTNISNYASVLVSGNGTAKGHVYDQDGETPLEGATLTFTGKDEFENDVVYDNVTTNEEGFYTADIKVGTYKVKASLADFEDLTINDVVIVYDEETEKDFIMSETQYKPTKVTAEVQDDGIVKVKWTMDHRSLKGFNVYMWQTVGDGIATDEPKIDTLVENITATTWYDNDWREYPAGVYQYGVEALYSGNHNPSRDGEELTVCDGTITNSYVPVYGLYADAYLKCNMVYPAEMLADMEGGVISSMKFYLNTPAAAAWDPAHFVVYMKEINETTLSAYTEPENATIVYEGSLNGTGTEMVVTFDTPYEYNGGNLLVGINNTVIGTYKSAIFCGIDATGASIQGFSYSSLSAVPVNQRNFLPKTTFSYEAASTITWSNTLEKDMLTGSFTFKVSTNDQQSVEGAYVTMTNVSEPEMSYEFYMDATGEYQITDFRKGVYNIEVVPADDDHDAFTAENVNLWNAKEYEATLNETAFTVENIYVSHTGYARWDKPTVTDRDFLGYKLYVENELVEEYFEVADTCYQINCEELELVPGESYKFTVGVVQNSKENKTDVMFDYSGCSAYDPTSDPNYYSPEPAVECNNVLVTWGVEPEPDEFKEGFESGSIPTGWTTIDADGDGFNWTPASVLMAGYLIPAHGGADCISSQSYSSLVGALTPDNYLVSPKVKITTGSEFSFWACAQDPNYASEHYGVAISTTTATAGAFTTIAEWTMTAKETAGAGAYMSKNGKGTREGNWYQKTVDLSDYAGQEIYIAIRHFDCSDQFYLDVDDVELSVGLKGVARGGSSTLTYDFEDGTLQGWTAIDNDGDGYNWYATTDYASNSGSYAVASESYNSSPLYPDNYLVSPQVTLGAGASISFYEKAAWGWPEPLYVLVSTTGTNPTDFTLVQEWSGLFNQSFEQKTVDLSAYAGQQVYIAFRHTNSSDNYAIVLDDITINGVAGDDPYPGNPELTRNSWALYLDGELLECVSKNIRHYEMTIEESGDHTFKVVSIDGEYNMSCGEEATFTAGVTTKPDSLAATVENNGIKLSWVGNSSEYKVYKGWAENDLYEIETVETAEEYFDPQLKACWYGVSGVSECGESAKATVSSSITDEMHWNPQISWFTEEMTVTGVVSINNKEQFNSDLEIGAFINGECCGSARGLNLNGRSYFKFQVHGDDATQVVTFKVYDHSEDIELGYVSKTTLNFAAGTIVGDVDAPSIFKFISTDEHPMVLAAGYNWVSTYIELSGEEGLDIIKAGLGANAQQISSNLAYVQYNPADGKWYGALNTAKSEEMYVIKMSETANVCFTGMVADPEEHADTLVQGWNWIGFISGQEMNLATALGTITPSEGDLIKSHVEYAKYNNGSWSGSLNTMEPGQGYKYKQNGEVQQILTYPVATRVESVADNASAAESHWTADASCFAMNMSVTAAVSVDGSLVENGDIEVGAFCNGEVRGSARPVYVEALDRHVIFLTVFGNEGDNITFRLFNAEDGSEYTAAEHLVYSDDAIKGGIEDPFMLNFGGDDNISVFPNPTKGNVIVSADGMKNISVVNTLGQTVYRQAANAGEMTIDMSQFGAGMYLISIETENGTTVKHITVTR